MTVLRLIMVGCFAFLSVSCRAMLPSKEVRVEILNDLGNAVQGRSICIEPQKNQTSIESFRIKQHLQNIFSSTGWLVTQSGCNYVARFEVSHKSRPALSQFKLSISEIGANHTPGREVFYSTLSLKAKESIFFHKYVREIYPMALGYTDSTLIFRCTEPQDVAEPYCWLQ